MCLKYTEQKYKVLVTCFVSSAEIKDGKNVPYTQLVSLKFVYFPASEHF